MPLNKIDLDQSPQISLFHHISPPGCHYKFQNALSQELFEFNSFFFYNDLRYKFAKENSEKTHKKLNPSLSTG